MGHHIGNETTNRHWTEHCNDLIHRVCELYPQNFVGVCHPPQPHGVPIAHSIGELERCVNELGFIGCNLNPDPSGGNRGLSLSVSNVRVTSTTTRRLKIAGANA